MRVLLSKMLANKSKHFCFYHLNIIMRYLEGEGGGGESAGKLFSKNKFNVKLFFLREYPTAAKKR